MTDLARGVLIAALVVETGLLAFAGLVLEPARRAVPAQPPAQRSLRLALLGTAVVIVVAAGVGLAAGDGGRAHAGWIVAIVAGLVIATALATARAPGALAQRPRVALLAAAAVALLGVPALLGHAGDADPGLVVPANVLHVAAAAAWTGGIAGLLALLAASGDDAPSLPLLAAVVGRFSAVALLAVLAISLSGLLEGLVLVRRVDALVTTGYGRIVALKALLLCALAALGAVQRGRTLPDLHDAASGSGDAIAARRLLRTVLRGEALLLTLVLLATGVLAATPPSRSGAAHAAVRDLRAGPFAVHVRVAPASPGANRIDIGVGVGVGATVPVPTLVARQPKLGIGPLTLRVVRRGPSRFVVARAPLDAPGTWAFTLTLHGSRAAVTRFTVRLR